MDCRGRFRGKPIRSHLAGSAIAESSSRRLPQWCRCSDRRGAGPVWQALVNFQSRAESPLVLKASLLPSAAARFCEQAKAQSIDLAVQAHAGSGIILGFAGRGLPLEAARMLLARWQEWASMAIGQRGSPTLPYGVESDATDLGKATAR